MGMMDAMMKRKMKNMSAEEKMDMMQKMMPMMMDSLSPEEMAEMMKTMMPMMMKNMMGKMKDEKFKTAMFNTMKETMPSVVEQAIKNIDEKDIKRCIDELMPLMCSKCLGTMKPEIRKHALSSIRTTLDSVEKQS